MSAITRTVVGRSVCTVWTDGSPDHAEQARAHAAFTLGSTNVVLVEEEHRHQPPVSSKFVFQLP